MEWNERKDELTNEEEKKRSTELAIERIHTNQKRFQCERSREKRAVLR